MGSIYENKLYLMILKQRNELEKIATGCRQTLKDLFDFNYPENRVKEIIALQVGKISDTLKSQENETFCLKCNEIEGTKPHVLNADSELYFRALVKGKEPFIAWVYFEQDHLDICRALYLPNLHLSVRGCSYFFVSKSKSISDYSLEDLQKCIHSFLRVEEPTIEKT